MSKKYTSMQAILADHPAPANVSHVSQDHDGKVYGYFAKPTRPNGSATWEGIGKVLIVDVGVENRIAGWHNYYLNKPVDKAAIELEAKKQEIKKGRQFGDLPDDYGIAVAYAKKVANSRDRNVAFELSFEQYRDLFLTDTCCVSGEKLDHNGTGMGMNQHSIDRLDPNKGYVVGNCAVMASTINNVKGELDRMLSSALISDEHKLKLLYKAEHVLRKRIKEKEKEERARTEANEARDAGFKSRFAIFPK